jgi:hypothetical protein
VQTKSQSGCVFVLLALDMTFKALAGADLQIYTDSLTNSFEDRGWTTRNFANTEPVHSGKNSIRVTPTDWWQGISIYHLEFDTTPYASISFWANGGSDGGQRIQVLGLYAAAKPSTNGNFRFTAATNTWEKITVPLATLGVADFTNCSGLWIQLATGGASNTFYIDDIQFNAKPAAQAAAPVIAAPAAPAAPADDKLSPVWWIAGVLTVITGLLAWLILMLRKSGLGKANVLTQPLVPAVISSGDNENWKDRALAAETMASRQAQVLSEKVIPELTEFAKQSLVQGLYSQRNALLETQHKAQQELVTLEARLARLQLPFQERIHAYEKRVTELERELDTRGEEMRELTKATLLLMRQKLEEEKQREHERRRFN